MQYQQYDGDYQDDMDETAGHVKREISQQPKNNQHDGKNPQHFRSSFLCVAEGC
jgi:hypothetical protein